MLIQKSLSEVVGDLVSERTSPRDKIQLEVTYNPGRRPTFILMFSTFDKAKQHHPQAEDITPWVKDYDTPALFGDGTPNKTYICPFSSWQDAVRDTGGISRTIEAIVNASGVQYELLEK